MFKGLSFSSIAFLLVLTPLSGWAKDLVAMEACSKAAAPAYGPTQDYSIAIYHGQYLFEDVRPTYLTDTNLTVAEQYLKAIELNDPKFLPKDMDASFKFKRSKLPRPTPMDQLLCVKEEAICYLQGYDVTPLSVALVHGKAKVASALKAKFDVNDRLVKPDIFGEKGKGLALLSMDPATVALYEIDASVDYNYVLQFIAKTENNPWFYKNPSTSVIKLIEKVYASFPANVQSEVISKFAGNLGGYGTSVAESPYLIDFILSRGGYDKYLTSNLGIYHIRGINRSFGKTLAYKDVMHRFIQRGYNAKTFRYLSFFDHTALADYCGSDFPSLLKFLKSEQLVDKNIMRSAFDLTVGGANYSDYPRDASKSSYINYFNVQTFLREEPSYVTPFIPSSLVKKDKLVNPTDILRFYVANGWSPYKVASTGQNNEFTINYLHLLMMSRDYGAAMPMTLEFLDELIANGTDFSRRGNDISGLIYLVAQFGDALAERLPALIQLGLELNLQPVNGTPYIPLHMMTLEAPGLARKLVELGIGTDEVLQEYYAYNPAYPGSQDRSSAPYYKGTTVLMWLASRVYDISYVLTPTTNVSATDARGYSALFYAAALNHGRNMDLLLAHGASGAVLSKDNEHFLHVLFEKGSVYRPPFQDCDIEKYLSAVQPVINAARVSDGKTVMHLAAIEKLPKCMAKIADFGGSVSMLDKAGKTPLDYLNDKKP